MARMATITISIPSDWLPVLDKTCRAMRYSRSRFFREGGFYFMKAELEFILLKLLTSSLYFFLDTSSFAIHAETFHVPPAPIKCLSRPLIEDLPKLAEKKRKKGAARIEIGSEEGRD